jgi:hypothetical protein
VRLTEKELCPTETVVVPTRRPNPWTAPSTRTEIAETGAGEILKVAVALIAFPDTKADGHADDQVHTVWDAAVGVGLEGLSSHTAKLFVY